MSEPDVFSALADPTRRTVLEEIASPIGAGVGV